MAKRKPESVYYETQPFKKSYDSSGTLVWNVGKGKAKSRAKDRAAMLRYVLGAKAYARKSAGGIWKVFSDR